MFESMTDRIAGTFLMGLDVAVEFATLGEYRLVESDLPAPDDFQPLPLVRRPAHLTAVAADQKLLPPASTAIARAAAESAARVAERRGVVIPSAPRRRPTTAGTRQTGRKRGGAVESGTQLCLFNR
jgi:hypothetical protein